MGRQLTIEEFLVEYRARQRETKKLCPPLPVMKRRSKLKPEFTDDEIEFYNAVLNTPEIPPKFG